MTAPLKPLKRLKLVRIVPPGSDTQAPNHTLIVVFEQLIRYAERQASAVTGSQRRQHGWRLAQFKKALSSIRQSTSPITSAEQALSLPGVGRGIAARIGEILRTGTLSELAEEIKVDRKTRIINQLASVIGIGEVTAASLYDQGITGLDDLKTRLESGKTQLCHQVTVGLKYHADINQTIPRDEITQIYSVIKTTLSGDLTVEICGSYRRGRATSNDIDVLVTDSKYGCPNLTDIVQKLSQVGLLLDHLTTHGTTKYMGICAHPEVKVARRIDIRVVKPESYYPAVLYFTGSKTLNQRMRQAAIDRGYTLNEYGLYRQESGQALTINSERDIFDYLGMTYLEPSARNPI